MSTQFSQIPVNIITGFLGVGKTTAIQYLLQNKPDTERWAVLVNEFGEIGIDAGLMSNEEKSGGVFMKEVPGGCMCCTAGLPMQIALNQLIRQAKPDRLIIEPTGLGHPLEVIRALQQPEYAGVLDLCTTVTLVDARKLEDPRYTGHETFNQQIMIADLVVAHKTDLYQGIEAKRLSEYLDTLTSDAAVVSCSNGQLEPEWLIPSSRHKTDISTVTNEGQEGHSHQATISEPDCLPECGYLRKDNQGEGYCSSGWVFSPEFEFSYNAIESLFMGLDVERLKAVMISDEGIFAFNLADSVLKVQALDEVMDSRIEVIGQNPDNWRDLEVQLLKHSIRL
ncbi:CobW family GTP-binding protein [Amphritea balenae]|uniref:Cobalamin biosynthesis protein CobW n=1 Tax=Amphritea balenae TaxID=452629 RepID=A0A3P1SKK8_9GAMM|nr:GTP-binding protein [Amphritea balenae]RRC97626.1 cobalamin biosynthesis protein CobW [Amphritea balenae]GGK73575.1 hypothetical protein GCM10007941_24510 [Amphritea balenae]